MPEKQERKLGAAGWGALHALGAVAYVLLVAGFIHSGFLEEPEGPLGFASFLLLFSLSAAVMACLVFGRPVMWYLDGHRKEAVMLAFYTILFMLLAVIIFLAIPGLIDARPPVFRVDPL